MFLEIKMEAWRREGRERREKRDKDRRRDKRRKGGRHARKERKEECVLTLCLHRPGDLQGRMKNWE